MRPTPDRRRLTVLADAWWTRAVRWVLPFAAGAWGALHAEPILPAQIAFGLGYALLGWAWAWVWTSVVARRHGIERAGDEVTIDGEPVARWRADPRIGRVVLTDRDSLHGYIDEGSAESPEPAQGDVEIVESLGEQTFIVRSWREAPPLWPVGAAWLLATAAVALGMPGHLGALLGVALGGLLLAFALAVLVAAVADRTGLDTVQRIVRVSDSALHVDGQRLPLARTHFFRVEEEGGAALYAEHDGGSTWLLRHRVGVVAWLQQRLLEARRRAGGGLREEAEVPLDLQALRSASARTSEAP